MPRQNRKILLIEEHPTLLEITALRLELLGYNLVKAESGEDALDWLQNQLPALIIVHQLLPGIDGIEFLNRLSSDTRTSRIPAIFLSVNSDLEDLQKAYNAGADEYLATPYDPVVLEAKIERLATAPSPRHGEKSNAALRPSLASFGPRSAVQGSAR